MTITALQLAAIAGTKKVPKYAAEIAAAINKYAPIYGVTTQDDLANLLSNIVVETGGFTRMDENLNYSAKRLMQVWPSRFPTLASTKGYANNPTALANKVYGGRMGNAGKSNAGWLYRGSGPGQVTGFTNFATCERLTGLPFTQKPDLMRDPEHGTHAALSLWKDFGMSKLASSDKIVAARKKWNGGTHGLDIVQAARKRADKQKLSVAPVVLVVKEKPKPAPAIDPAAEPVVVVQAGPMTDKATVQTVQSLLWDKGYTEIGSRKPDGSFDGDKGNLTDTAIMAAKKENNFEPINADITADFLIALPKFPARKLSSERTNATAGEVAGKVPEARMSWWQQIVTGATTVVTSIVGVVMGIAQFFGVAEGTVMKVKEYFADVPGEVWLGVTAVVALGMFLLARRGLLASKDAFNTAARR